jgi:hypothetical protein
MNLYKIEILVNELCDELCYVVAFNIDEAKKLVIEDYKPTNIVFKKISKIYGNLIVGN